ncbi:MULTISPECIES: NRAMP family divalent metal transporter [Deinococcus]|uniref:NRAMP family divalent metal transporter n=1 Tax=Deinococcus rufus TaxID=2136097 RepID=A0ABV7Z679_9DEIO|nr:divalent metal cation transporter [Deinococcus sp. AB2017081]WQE97219.1 divalent metal cation transporter [Deinococcus sp. AB2017081]
MDKQTTDHPTADLQVDSTQRRPWWRLLGPGVITGASDDDPSGIATYSQVGAQFGFGLLWTMPFSYPLMAVTQEISARVGRVTGHGLAGNLRRHFAPGWLYLLSGLLLVANTINLGADLGAMGAAMKLVIGGHGHLYTLLFGVGCVLAQVFVPYHAYVRVLKWLSASLLAYVAVVLAVRVPWGAVLRATVLPHLTLSGPYLQGLIAVLGTTISPYLFFWQASQEVEDLHATPGEERLTRAPEQAPQQFRRIRVDTFAGMGFSNLVAFFIILTAAVTLHAGGVTTIQTAAQAAEALRPLAGNFAFVLFSLGIIGTGLLAVPVLAGSAAYAVGEALRWPVGLERRPLAARGFYGILTAATLVGVALNFSPVDPVRALYWSAIVNGVTAGPVMIALMLMASRHEVMGQFTLPRVLRVVGWLATALMLAASAAMLLTL